MKILIGITYYRPHMSGLTIYAERLAKQLVKMGHTVTVLSSQFSTDLPLEEIMDGVRVIRVPVKLKISKSGLMPSFGRVAGRLIHEHDIVHLHLPQFDAARVAFRAWLLRKPCVITYHCDLQLPKGIINWFVNQVVQLMNNLAAFFAKRVVTYTQDYADHSRFVSRYKQKLQVINPPVELPVVQKQEIADFRKQNNPDDDHPIIGMAARFATEKGVEVLLNALGSILEKYPETQVWFAGPHENVMQEQHYYARLKPQIDDYRQRGNWKFLGLLSPREMALFYPNLDILTIPSLNSTEAFGLIQIEAMIHGVPSIASNLPGVRQPVLRHKMGEIIPIGSSESLARAVGQIMQNREIFKQNCAGIADQYTPRYVAAEYITLFRELIGT